MKLQDFEKHIEEKIVKRGFSYFRDGDINSIERVDKYEFSAVVIGTEEYDVYLKLNGRKEILEHSCSCPYSWGVCCKHEVAVMYYVREEKLYNQPLEESTMYKIKEDLKKMSKSELVKLVVDLSKRNNRNRKEVLWELGYEIEEEEY